ncbi:MAG: hypothetical protein Q8O49_00365, partial [bacterium]|nr:hypothetical protein [bacterium]
MGIYFLWALICAAVGTIPLLIAKRFIGAIIQAAVSFFILWPIFYVTIPTTVWPLFGGPGFMVLILWVIGAVINAVADEDDHPLFPPFIPMIASVVAYVIAGILGNEFMRTEDYRGMIGPMEVREWTQDIQPKDPQHMRMSTPGNAIYMAQKVIGQDGTIGSQFQINSGEIWLQKIQSELWYVAALEFKSYGAWKSKGASPGYVMVSAENPDLQPRIVNLDQNKQMRYLPSGYFDKNLERHLRNNGYLDKGLAYFSLEIDDSGNPWWIVPTYKPEIMWWATKITGAALVNPATGQITFYPLGNVPDWVDRVVPGDYVTCYLDWWG